MTIPVSINLFNFIIILLEKPSSEWEVIAQGLHPQLGNKVIIEIIRLWLQVEATFCGCWRWRAEDGYNPVVECSCRWFCQHSSAAPKRNGRKAKVICILRIRGVCGHMKSRVAAVAQKPRTVLSD